jgi:hypothetical protein
LLIVFNAGHSEITFRTPESSGRHAWKCLLDTRRPNRPVGTMQVRGGDPFPAGACSVYVFALDHDGFTNRPRPTAD